MLTAYNELDSATDDDKGESSKCTNISAASATNNDNSCLRCSRRDQTQHLNRTNCLCLISHNNINQAIIHQSQFISRNSMIFRDPGQLYNYINKCRKWIKVWNPGQSIKRNREFSLTSYNILSQNLLVNHPYLYEGICRNELKWSERAGRIRNELLEMNSDVFCLQEVHIENFQETILPTLLDNGYQAVFKQKTGSQLDGCSILFKKNKFQLKETMEVEFKRPDISHLLDKDNVALLVKLRPIGTESDVDANLVIANTHLLFNPKRGDIKLAQLRLLFAEIHQFSQLNKLPVILCGDMNSEPRSPLVRFIVDGKLNLTNLKSGDISGQREGIQNGRPFFKHDLLMKGINCNSCFDENIEDNTDGDSPHMTIQHMFQFRSTYPVIDEYNQPLASIFTNYDIGLVDHIFYSYRHPNLRLSAFRQLPNNQNIIKIGHLPNSILGSDHMSLSAKFYLL